MIDEHPRGTADRAVGVPIRTDNTKPKTTGRSRRGDAGDRWTLSNAIDKRLGWMPPRDRLVLRVLFMHANAKTGRAFPSTTTIGRDVGVHRGHVSRLLRRLVRWGVIEVVRSGEFGNRQAGEYRIRPASEWPTEKPPD